MNRLSAVLAGVRDSGGKALVAFLSAGYPDPDRFARLSLVAQQAGCDALEIGIPFSDPSADGLVIQQCSQRALEQGVTVEGAIAAVSRLRQDGLAIPVILMTYLNPVLAFGIPRFMEMAAGAGVEGLLVVDLPYEESEELRRQAERERLDVVGMVAPTTRSDRAALIAAGSAGFVYCVSSAGVTGEGRPDATAVASMVQRLRGCSPLPALIGFGVDGPETAAALCRVADGVIVGSALLRVVAGSPTDEQRPFAFLRSLRLALDATEGEGATAG